MAQGMKHSHSVDFLSGVRIEIGPLVEELRNSQDVEPSMLKDILKNIDTLVGEQESEWIRRNGMECMVDYLVQRYKFKRYPIIKKLNPFPVHLLIEPTSICNLRCTMCFQSDSTFRTKDYTGMMDLGFFKDIVDQSVENGCRFITLASRGEPLLHKDFPAMLRYCKDKFLEFKINTNAMCLDDGLSREILESGVDIAVFSVDTHEKKAYEEIRVGGDFDRVLKNIRRFDELRGLREEYKKTATRISGVFLGKGQSKESFVDFWRGYADQVTITDAVMRWDTYGNEKMDHSSPCSLMWERMYVWFDGTCNPCDYDYKSTLKVGDAKKTPLKEIWTGETYQRYRDMLLAGKRKELSPCNRCNIY